MSVQKPTEYLTNEVFFLNRQFYIDEGAHIPRRSTQYIAKVYIDSIVKIPQNVILADIGTGTGVLAISCVLECPNIVKAYATELYPEALAVAKKNVETHNVKEKVELFMGDLIEPLLTRKVEVFIANLPFADDEKIKALRPEVLEYEPLTGIYGGKTGFELYTRLFDQFEKYKYLKEIKAVWIFCHKDHLKLLQIRTTKLFPKYKLHVLPDLFKDYYAHCLIENFDYHNTQITTQQHL